MDERHGFHDGVPHRATWMAKICILQGLSVHDMFVNNDSVDESVIFLNDPSACLSRAELVFIGVEF